MSSESDPAITIRVEGLGKRYLLGEHIGPQAQYRTARAAIRHWGRSFRRCLRLDGASGQTEVRVDEFSEVSPQSDQFWALRDVAFDVARGESVAILGHNGAGKSTLLKIISRVTEPTEGRVEITGRVGALLEVGTGFHPELTGRENVYLSGSIRGLSRKQVDACFDEILAFSEIERFIDTPVKRYSSGMRSRLAFAVSTTLRPDILIVDEVLAVGDLHFRQKCMARLADMQRDGVTILFVSHSPSRIRTLCKRGLLLRHGRLIADGNLEDVLSEYLNQEPSTTTVTTAVQADETPSLEQPLDELQAEIQENEQRMMRSEFGELVGVELRAEQDQTPLPTSQVFVEDPFIVRLRCRLDAASLKVSAGLDIHTEHALVAAFRQEPEDTTEPGFYSFDLHVPGNLLSPNLIYRLSVALCVYSDDRTFVVMKKRIALKLRLLTRNNPEEIPLWTRRTTRGVLSPLLSWSFTRDDATT